MGSQLVTFQDSAVIVIFEQGKLNNFNINQLSFSLNKV